MAPLELTRLPDSSLRLIALVNDWRAKPYAYGSTDCWQFTLAAVRCQTGAELMPGMVWPAGLVGVIRIMIDRGWKNLEQAMDEFLPSQPVGEARPGDIVSFMQAGEIHMAVRISDTALTPGLQGLVAFGSATWKRAWRVG